MKRVIAVLVVCMVTGVFTGAQESGGIPPGNVADQTLGNQYNQLDSMQMQQTNVVGGGDSSSFSQGGDASAEGGDAVGMGGSSDSVALAVGGNPNSNASSGSNSSVNINTTSISNYKSRTPPVSVVPPYLPYWTHGGWGTLKAYFPNGPSDDQVYERTFNPDNPEDMKEIRGVLSSLWYESPIKILGGILNGVQTVFGGTNNYHHGRGFEIASSFIRTTRPKSKPLLVFIDSNVDRKALRQAGYVYVGKVSVEGNVDRSWDHVYSAAVAEALLWDVDVLLVSGGMKGVTVGSNFTFPVAGLGLSQTNYSISLMGGTTSGVTEGKGKALLGAEGYRFWPEAAARRQIPQLVSDRFRVAPRQEVAQAPPQTAPAPAQTPVQSRVASGAAPAAPSAQRSPQQPAQEKPVATTRSLSSSPVRPSLAVADDKHVGVQVSKELFDLAGFSQGQQVQNLIVR